MTVHVVTVSNSVQYVSFNRKMRREEKSKNENKPLQKRMKQREKEKRERLDDHTVSPINSYSNKFLL